MVDADTPSWRAACRVESPATAASASSDTATRGRPSRRPWRLTRASPGPDPLGAPGALELTDGAEDVHLEFPRRGRRIDALRQRDESHPQRLEVIQ